MYAFSTKNRIFAHKFLVNMKHSAYIFITFLLLLATGTQPTAAQNSTADNIEQLKKEMYRLFDYGDYDSLKIVTEKLKEASLKAGDYTTYYKAWGNEAVKAVTKVSRAAGMEKVNAIREHAIEHDNKFGLYTAYYTMAYLLNQMQDTDGATENYKKAIEILEQYYPQESTAPTYVALSALVIQKKLDSLGIYYAQKALEDKRISKVHRTRAHVQICTGWGWLKNKTEFDKAYAELVKVQGNPKQMSDGRLTVEVFRAVMNNDTEEALRLCSKMKGTMSRLLYTYKTYEWAGDYQNTFLAYKKYILMQETLNKRGLRNQAQLYRTELDVARAENESKDLRLANKRLQIDHMTQELEHERLEAEATKLKLKNSEIELSNAAIQLENDSLERDAQKSRLNELKLRMEAQQEREHNHHIMIFAGALLALITISFLAFYLHRRQCQMRQLRQVNNDLKTAYDQLEEHTVARERMESELRIARNIQMGMLPHVFPQREDLDLHARMTPAKAVGGDLYDFFLQDDLLYLCIGDVSGKGVPASMFMSVCVKLFRTFVLEGFTPVEVANKMNESLAADNENGMFVTMFIATVDMKTGRMEFCNAGHNPPLLDGEYITVEPNAPLGLWPELDFVGEHLENIKGKSLFLYTDGITEAENETKDQYGEERLQELLKRNLQKNAQDTIDIIHESVSQFVGKAEPSDDITKLCLKIC